MKEHTTTKSATLGGILFVIIGSLTAADLVKTVIIAAVGAATSYLTAVLLKKISGRKDG
jgi:hypothetical protein